MCRAMQPMEMCWITPATIQAQGTRPGRTCLPTGPLPAIMELATVVKTAAAITKAKDPQAIMDLAVAAIRTQMATIKDTTRATTEGGSPCYAIVTVQASETALLFLA